MIHTNDKVIKHKVGLLNLAEELGNVSKACKMMGLSRDTFYRYKTAADEGGVQALFDRNRLKCPHSLATRLPGYVLCRYVQGHWPCLPADIC